MRKTQKSVLVGILAVTLFCLTILLASAGPRKRHEVKPDLKRQALLPDLTVSVKLTKKKYEEGFLLFPLITVTNKGQSTAAAGYDIKIERLPKQWGGVPGVPNFFFPKSIPTTKLRPGESKTYGPFDIELYWCGKRVGVRVTVDSTNKIAEKNEGNNIAVVYFNAGISAHRDVLKNKASSTPASTQVTPKLKRGRPIPISKQRREQPDLSAKISFTSSGGTTVPVFTVLNTGRVKACNFRVEAYYSIPGPGDIIGNWSLYGFEDITCLQPGKKRKVLQAVDFSPKLKYKYRLVVDTNNTVHESYETNNTAEALSP